MNHHATADFWAACHQLPAAIQETADAAFTLLKSNPRHPSLHFKKAGAFWSARVGIHYRALAVESENDLIWFWIGSHADYDKLVR